MMRKTLRAIFGLPARGRARARQGHGWLLLANLYPRADGSWQAPLIGALMWLQLRVVPPSRLMGALPARLDLPMQDSHY